MALTEAMSKAVAVGMATVSLGSVAMVGSSNTQSIDHTVNSAVLGMCGRNGTGTASAGASGAVDAIIEQAEKMAKDDSIGYSQAKRRLDPDVDCSSFVWYALTRAGIKDLGSVPFNTHSMDDPLNRAGFVKHEIKDRSDLKKGDVLWRDEHTEIYIGDGRTIGAHEDLDGRDGDSSGNEVSEAPYAQGGFTYYYRMENASVNGGTQNVSAATSAADIGGASKIKGWTVNDVDAHNDNCTYLKDQCTEWACVRSHMFGHKEVHNTMGNGEAWVNSAVALGWKKGVVAPGSIISWAAGSHVAYADGSGWTADGTYGHVAIVESVDTSSKTLVESEGGSGFYSSGGLNVKTIRYDPMPAGMSIAAPPGVSGDTSGDASDGSAVKDTDADPLGDCSVAQAADKEDSANTADATYSGDGTHATPDQAKAIAKQLLPSYFPNDHGKDQWEALEWIWTHESGWRWDATNPSSAAYGIPQSLPGSKMASAGKDWKDNAGTQIKWGLQYIKERYGTPLKAQEFWKRHNWY